MKTRSTKTKVVNWLAKVGGLRLLEKLRLRSLFSTLWNLVEYPTQLVDNFYVLKDYFDFRRKYGKIISAKPSLKLTDKKVLVVSISPWLAQIKEEALLAKALQLKGYQPVILTAKRYRMARRYFRLFGLNDFVFLDDLAKQVDFTVLVAQAEMLLRNIKSIGDLLAIKYQDVNVGNHSLSSLVRFLHEGNIDINREQERQMLKRMLPEAMLRAHAAEELLIKLNPEILIFFEKSYTTCGPFYDLALKYNKKVVQFVSAHKNNALVFKKYTKENAKIHPFSLSKQTWERVKSLPWTEEKKQRIIKEIEGHYRSGAWFNRQQLQKNKQLKSAEVIKKQLGLDPQKKTAIIFSHVLWDANFFYGEDLFETYGEWFIETVKEACKNSQLNWVIKVHPANIWRLERDEKSQHQKHYGKLAEYLLIDKAIGQLPGHVKIMPPETDINTFSLFSVADYILTVRGTIGIEAPCYGVPVFTAGTGRYAGLGFTNDSATRQEYLDKLSRLQEFPSLTTEQVKLARQHAYALFLMRPFSFGSFEIKYYHDKKAHVLDPRIEIKVLSDQGFANAKDLNQFADWVLGEDIDVLQN